MSYPSIPVIRVNTPIDASIHKSRRKQDQPQRSLKQLASVADKILHGIIVIEPFMPWEQPSQRTEGTSLKKKRKKHSHRMRSDDDNSDTSLGSPNFSQTARPTVTRSPAPMGEPLPEDSAEAGVSERRIWYEAVLHRRRSGPSRAGMPLDITMAPGSSLLDESEFETCSTLRLYPLQYFQSRETLLKNYHQRGFYKKSAAQKMLHIDVNKTGKLYDYFVSRGWMPQTPLNMDTVRNPVEVDWYLIMPN
ncbi:hypothetical protein PSACC_01841 [Paramicrosporidium saccamoebae]|uniref:SWIRM domain-containing protein n=1 Tax=Paramicrosporidium saccamoebae TaxID=1246581 RepID=A0A2H9TKT8_9FUNG|nr:hypothetical protein PSACC_01841 [Paramicrosporidium saccamoebae]